MTQIVITRAADQNSEMIEEAGRLGLAALALPLIETTALAIKDKGPLEELADGKFDIVIVTSANGARFLCDALTSVGLLSKIPAASQIAVVGERSAQAVLHYFGRSDLLGESSGSGEALLRLLKDRSVDGKRIFVGSAHRSHFPLAAELKQSGAIVQEVALYETRAINPSRPHIAEFCSLVEPVVAFLSPSAVDSFFAVPEFLACTNCRFAVIGKATAQAVTRHGAQIWHQASEAKGSSLLCEIASRL